ncbi:MULTISPECIES: ligand-binding sensor domain-containing protein [unclassified Carboxylicivirga]|uniref:ligand-binding sensor domain-containing protein n=1 Tax=Carboxylicivirga TaxID=1628153 RepID=UPI003D342FB2
MSALIERVFRRVAINGAALRFCFAIVLIVSGSGAAWSQRGHLSVEQFTISEGLSNSHITALFQDSRGYLWVGTTDGLNRYDGYNFVVFRHHPLEDSTLIGNYVQTIAETPDGNIWVGTRNNGIAIWKRQSGKFINLGKGSELFKSLHEYGVYGMHCEGENIWVKTRNAIAKVNYRTHAFTNYDHYSSVLKRGNSARYPVIGDEARVWFGSKDGIQYIEAGHKAIQRVEAADKHEQNEVSSLLGLRDSILLAGSSKGLTKYNIVDGTMTNLHKADSPYSADGIYSMVCVKGGDVWLATAQGLMYMHAPYEHYAVFPIPNHLRKSFTHISTIMEDASGLLWVGTQQNGLFKIDRKPTKFSTIGLHDDVEYPMDCYDFTAVFVDEHSNLWLGSAQQGLYWINRANRQFRQYTIYPPFVSRNDPSVNTIYKDSKDKIWLGTEEGIFILHKGSKRVQEFDYGNNSDFRYLLKSNTINDIIEDRLGDMWFATQFGLYRYDGQKMMSYWADDDDEYGLCDDEINVLFQDVDGLLWIGTNNGVNTYNVVSKTFQRIQNQKGEPRVLSNNIISAFAEDHDKIVIGTHSGLSYFDKNRHSSGFWEYDDLVNAKIYGLEIDAYNRIWISTGNGISSIIPGTPPFKYNRNDGVPDYNFNVGASFRHGNSELLFGGDKGLTIINTEEVPINNNKPKMVINGVKVFHKGKVVNQFQGEHAGIDVLYRRNTMVQVSFAALEYTYPKANTYRVKLEGHDEDWRDVTLQNFVNFSNLSPGSYTLKVIGSNNDGVPCDKPAELLISVNPPLWMSGYAYAFYIIFGILLIQTLINYRIRNYRKAYQALNEKAGDKQKIEEQKERLSRIHQSLTDSISYAKRIQEAMIPSEDMVKEIIPDSFIYFRPKDIVSGDFYWVYRREQKVFLAAVDCTGHGVPGAFMSIIGYDLLKKIVEIQEVSCTARILNRLSEEVAQTFKANSKEIGMSSRRVDDGMDIALVMIDEEQQVLHFAGAMNPLYIVRDNEIMTFKGDRFAIGYRDEEKQLSYSRHEIKVYPGDVIYLFSDGFADQFGGPEGKKFKYRRFRHLLLNIHKLPIDDQKAILHQKMEDWMGTEYEQVDDILLMGFRL